MIKEETWVENLRVLHKYEDDYRLRHTPERETILRTIVEHPQAFSPSDVYSWVKDQHISRATVYNTLNHLVSAQILHCLRQQTDSKRLQYELALTQTNHIQLKCTRCGRVSNIKDPAIKRLIFDRRFSNFATSHYSLYIYGVCHVCRKLKIGK